MNSYLNISNLNDFIFCPVSIYFHNLYNCLKEEVYQSEVQIKGKVAHKSIDNGKYSNRKKLLQAIPIYSEKYNIVGNIDIFNVDTGELIERKKHVNKVYDGFIFQLYAQYYCLTEMGYEVKSLKIYSYDDNKNYKIDLPDNNKEMKEKFERLVIDINNFDPSKFVQTNKSKCQNCIYFDSCDRGLSC